MRKAFHIQILMILILGPCPSHAISFECLYGSAKPVDINFNDKGIDLPMPIDVNSFCFTDSETGIVTELILYDGGEASILISKRAGVVIRSGTATWRGENDGVGGKMPRIIVKLSTGVVLSFEAVVLQFSSKISMLIDTSGNRWLSCPVRSL